MTEPYRIGIDVGGTFTDCVLLRPDGTVTVEKTPTTTDDQSVGVLDGLRRLAEAETLADVQSLLGRCESIVHGTTTADNTMIQMSGASTGLIVTAGYRDEIELRRCFKEDIWDPALEPPPPIARRRVRLEVAERLNAEGEVEVPLDEAGVRNAAARLRAFGVTSIAVTFLYSYLNPAHELRARELILEEFPEVELISLSHEVHPKPPEFERISTTLVNAYVWSADRPLPRPSRGRTDRCRVSERVVVGHVFGRGGHALERPVPPPPHDELGPDGRGRGRRSVSGRGRTG